MANYPCKTFSPTTYPLTRVHPLQTDRRTDGQTTTMLIARPLLKYGWLKKTKETTLKILPLLPRTVIIKTRRSWTYEDFFYISDHVSTHRVMTENFKK